MRISAYEQDGYKQPYRRKSTRVARLDREWKPRDGEHREISVVSAGWMGARLRLHFIKK